MNRIIQQKIEQPNREEWILQLSDVVTNIDELLAQLQLNQAQVTSEMLQAKKQFPLRVPKAFIARMEKGNWHDPLLQQVLCRDEETHLVAGYSHDPLQEQDNAIPGLLHKYHNRALLITKTNCAINCRYCFRRHFPYSENQGNKHNLTQALDYIASHTELDEIILSGGDPLMAKDHELHWLIDKLDTTPHIKRLRIHSRLAVVIPSRITDSLCQLFQQSRLQVVMVTHINHPQEIDNDVRLAMKKLKTANVALLNQGVLLKNINDNADTLVELSNTLFDAGILPYYLHVLDKVQGAAHFMVEDQQAIALMQAISKRLSGYLVPKLAREIGGEKSKTILHY